MIGLEGVAGVPHSLSGSVGGAGHEIGGGSLTNEKGECSRALVLLLASPKGPPVLETRGRMT